MSEQKNTNASTSNNDKDSSSSSETATTAQKPKFTPGTYVQVSKTVYKSGKVWKQPKDRFSVKKTRAKETYEEQMEKKKELQEIKEIERQIKADMEEENKIEKRKMEQRRQARIEKIIRENKNKPLKQGRGKCKGRNKRLTEKDVHRVKIYHETQGLF
ncbi:hypothetical protein FDP41_009611 [Naegleria fowleri]|uniref:Coiled-coil domain-containing protein 86 n=1 Tax=Naegleria fowleri TaxID=5763 RepID=A0A6A5BCQ4_NAEFO|nr:uncharacterized protein FDP41_009611 [Naegleria fowleri]KAF0971915.1 hypothetical protein FDP41_009611 [Naegleria fowleri]CAG4719112.1 unnamed protein product [Naegleria fowleri]